MAKGYRFGNEWSGCLVPKSRKRNGISVGANARRRRRDSKNEQEQGRTSQQVALPTPGGFIQGAPASSLELDPLRVRRAHVECGGAGEFRYSKGSKKISVKYPEEWRSDGRGCTPMRLVNGSGMKELFAKNKKKETCKVRTQETLKKTAKVGTLAPSYRK